MKQRQNSQKNRLHCIISHLSNRPDELLSTLKRFLGVKRDPFARVCEIPVLPGLNVCGGGGGVKKNPGFARVERLRGGGGKKNPGFARVERLRGGKKNPGFARVERLRGVKKIPVLPGLNVCGGVKKIPVLPGLNVCGG